jgi:hypothetical protein
MACDARGAPLREVRRRDNPTYTALGILLIIEQCRSWEGLIE